MSISGEQVWTTLMADKRSANIPGIQILQPYVTALPDILATMLEEKVTVASYMKARIKYYKYLSDKKVATKQIALIPRALLHGHDPELVAKKAEAALTMAIEMMERIIPLIPDMLRSKGLTEEKYFISPAGLNLSHTAREKYKQDSLTIGDLLTLEPYTFVCD